MSRARPIAITLGLCLGLPTLLAALPQQQSAGSSTAAKLRSTREASLHGSRGGAAPSEQDALAFITRLDQAFNDGKVQAYLDQFDKTQQFLFFTALEQRLGKLIKPGVHARSTLRSFFVRGQVGVALIETELQAGKRQLNTLSYLAFELREGKAVGRFAIETSPAALRGAGLDSAFRCKACNYEIRFDDTWLAIPRIASRDHCMEAIWLVSLQDDIYIETGVHIGNARLDADKILDRCLSAADGKGIGTAPTATTSKWLPLSFRDQPLPEAVRCGRATTCCPKNYLAEMSLVTAGRLRYLTVVRARAEDLQLHRQRIDAVVDSFRILDLQLTAEQMASIAESMHTGGGILRGGLYTNQHHHFTIEGPRGWRGKVRAGGWLFRLTYLPPADLHQTVGAESCRLTVQANAADAGPWTRARVDRQLRKLVREVQRGKTKAKVELTAWSENKSGFATRQVRIGSEFLARFLMRREMLIFLRGTSADAEVLRGIEQAMDTARWLR